jgi:hypothetical protein
MDIRQRTDDALETEKPSLGLRSATAFTGLMTGPEGHLEDAPERLITGYEALGLLI